MKHGEVLIWKSEIFKKIYKKVKNKGFAIYKLSLHLVLVLFDSNSKRDTHTTPLFTIEPFKFTFELWVLLLDFLSCTFKRFMPIWNPFMACMALFAEITLS